MSNEAPFQMNFKTPKGALVNIRAWSEAELDQYLDSLLQRIHLVNDVELAIEAICTVNGNGLKVTSVSGLPTPDRAVGATHAPAPSNASAGWTPPPTGAAPNCEHGEPMRLVPAGVSKAGKPYKAFFACARQRAEACNAKG
jgi:hypothetical protein